MYSACKKLDGLKEYCSGLQEEKEEAALAWQTYIKKARKDRGLG
jgi:hypothetical protein